jgi:hypothetical protein
MSQRRRRIFANGTTSNYIDINECKRGREIYRNINSKIDSGSNRHYLKDMNFTVADRNIIQYHDYDTYRTLAKTCACESSPSSPVSIEEGKHSFVRGTCSCGPKLCEKQEGHLYPYGINPYKEEKRIEFPRNIRVEENRCCRRQYPCNGTYAYTNPCCCPVLPEIRVPHESPSHSPHVNNISIVNNSPSQKEPEKEVILVEKEREKLPLPYWEPLFCNKRECERRGNCCCIPTNLSYHYDYACEEEMRRPLFYKEDVFRNYMC